MNTYLVCLGYSLRRLRRFERRYHIACWGFIGVTTLIVGAAQVTGRENVRRWHRPL